MVSKKYYYDIDLRGNRLLNFAVESVSGELPSEANEGAVIYHSGEGVMYQRLKDGWKVIASGKDLEDALSKVSEDLQALSKDTEEALDTKADKTTVSSLSNTLTKEIQDRQAGDNTNATAISTHATNKSNPHGVTKAQVGLGNVDNTSDVNKPISTAVQNALNGKAGTSVATQSANGLMSSADKKKLDGIASGAQVNVIEAVKVNGTALTPSSKAVDIDLSDYVKKGDVTTVMRYKGSVSTVTSLPTTATLGDTYNVIDTNANYTWDGSAWDLIGSTVDLSGYATKTEVNSALSGKVSKTGDTMSGNLTVENTVPQVVVKNSKYAIAETVVSNWTMGEFKLLDNTGAVHAKVGSRWMTNGRHNFYFFNVGQDGTEHSIQLTANSDSSAYATAPSVKKYVQDAETGEWEWVLDKADDSTKIATTEWVNQSGFLVHSYGNETVAGEKTFTTRPIVQTGLNSGLIVKSTDFDRTATFTSWTRPFQIVMYDKNGQYVSIIQSYAETNNRRGLDLMLYSAKGIQSILGLKYDETSKVGFGVAPTTPTNATSNEIATADWVRKKIASNDVHVGGDSTSGKWYRLATHPKVTPTYYDGHMMLAIWDNYRYNDYPVTRNGILNVHIRRANTSFNGNIRFILAGADIQYTSYALVLYSDFSAEVYAKQTNQYGRPSATRINHNIEDNNWIIDDADTTAVDSLDGLGGTILYSQPPLIHTPEDKADNSAVPVNAKWVNQSNFLVHSYGNETINGNKTFTTPIIDPQNQSGQINSPNSDASAKPYYKVASISYDEFGGWDTPTLTFDVERGWSSTLQNFCTFRVVLNTDGDKVIISARFSKIWGSGLASDVPLQADHWWLVYNPTLKEVQIWAKNEYNQLTLNYRVRMTGRRHDMFANWKLYKNGSSDGAASLPSADDGWTIIQADDISNRMTFSTPTDATGQEIVTADWSLGKFVKSSGDQTIDGQKTFTGVCASTNFTLLGDESVGRQGMTFRNYGGASTPNSGILINNSTNYIALSINSNADSPAIQIGHANVPAYAVKPPESAKGGEIVTANWSLDKFVQKSGDTMSGSLQILTGDNKTFSVRRNNLDRTVVPTYPASGDTNIQTLITLMDKNNAALSYVQRSERKEGTILSHVINQTANGALRNHQLNQVIAVDGSMYVTVPAVYLKSDNSNKVATTGWVNQADFLVHSYGNETISGAKTYTAITHIKSTNIANSETPSSDQIGTRIQFVPNNATNGDNTQYIGQIVPFHYKTHTSMQVYVKRIINGNSVVADLGIRIDADGTKSGRAPTPPSSATSNEIVTANWVNNKLAGKIHISANAPTASDGNDGDIWLQYE